MQGWFIVPLRQTDVQRLYVLSEMSTPSFLTPLKLLELNLYFAKWNVSI